jgi:hypothetical protein
MYTLINDTNKYAGDTITCPQSWLQEAKALVVSSGVDQRRVEFLIIDGLICLEGSITTHNQVAKHHTTTTISLRDVNDSGFTFDDISYLRHYSNDHPTKPGEHDVISTNGVNTKAWLEY